MDLLRFSTAGSVDDGKSTLIGRLLYDAKGVFEDQLEAVARSAVNRASTGIDLSLLTDGLRAEREQGITIDVAYRYFATPKRKFIIADTPGHEQYTRNMATGASTAQLAIVLIDARHGALVQSRRHTFIASMLGIPHLVVAVNKMDLVDYSQDRFDAIVADFRQFCGQLGYSSAQFIPLSALMGDNVVARSEAMPWYAGPSLLEHLETVDVTADENLSALRFPVQYVIRPHLDYRGFAGQITSGVVRVGDEVMALPAGTRSRVARIDTHDGPLQVAAAPRSVTLLLEDEIDLSRGDMLVHPEQLPWVRRELDAALVWMESQPLDPSRPYLLKHTTRTVRARVAAIQHRIDVNTLAQVPAQSLQLNEIARIRLSLAQPLYADAYAEHRRTGAFILIDPLTNATVAAGMIARDQADEAAHGLQRVDRATREAQAGHRATVLWLSGGTAEARTWLARTLEARLFQRGVQAFALTGAVAEEVARLGQVLLAAGLVVLVDADADAAQLQHAALSLGPDDLAVATVGAATDGEVAQLVQLLHDRGVFGAPRVGSAGAGI
jgi:sulfate adenylyltransferase large subunit